ncbi:hypothetical protein GH5_06179 [Leishmania sp. Ghana 2012 LV757]|uniref:hypothetical protein n=1 Tax=Leishmania sp. Ghana 2012 LV757 TaxID=2803181 RepID=UPI001B546046|nr:hypothetical protein GH5_06179 [Leishmania sp. Ghana 2012 LV757]
MPQDMAPQAAPLFRAGGRRSCDVFPSASKRHNPFIVVLGSSCGVQRAADDTVFPFMGGLAPSACPRGKSLLAAPVHRHPFFARSLGPQRPGGQRCCGSWRSSGCTPLSQLLSEEQVTRWMLRCEEQEERVEIALAKPSCRVLLSHAHSTLAFSSREGDDERLGYGSHSRPHLPPSEPVRPTADKTHSGCTGGRRTKTKRQCCSTRSGGLHEQPSSEAQDTASAPTLLYVRDSELLRALQRAEARVKELEASTAPEAPGSGGEENFMNVSSSTMLNPQAPARPGTIHPYIPLSPRLEIL